MKIVLSSDGSVELLRGERITRGQDLSRRIYVEWNENESPIDTGQILADNMAVQLCIARPDGEQSGWYSMIKIDAEDKYYYTLQAWDTAVAGIATVQVRWYDVSLLETDIKTDICEECGNQKPESGRPIYTSAEASFIVDNGKIAQPLNISSENYNDIVLQFITPLSNQAFRKYDVNKLPNTIIFSDDGPKTAPALYYNFSHDVIDIVSSSTNEYKEEKKTRVGMLIVDQLKDGNIQNEVFLNEGGIYYRKITDGVAEEFKSKLQTAETQKVDLTEYQKKIDGNLTTESKEVVGAINELNEKVEQGGSDIVVDPTLTVEGAPADAKAVGDKLDGKLDNSGWVGERWDATQILGTINSSGSIVYGKYLLSNSASSNSVPLRDARGRIKTKTPVADEECTNKKYVDDKFNGSNKAVSFVNYSSMITSLNALDNTSYSVGQNIMIVTLNVPDLWVSEIVEESVSYTYISDDDFVNEISTSGFVQVGYFKLSALETQKVDLTDYAKNEDVENKATLYSWDNGEVISDEPIYLRTSAGITLQNAPDGSGKKVLSVNFANDTQIRNKADNMALKTNQISLIVKTGVTTNALTLTEEEKAKALTWLGAYENFAPLYYTHNIAITIGGTSGRNDYGIMTLNDCKLIGTIKIKQQNAYTSLEQLNGLVFESVEIWEMSYENYNPDTGENENNPYVKKAYKNVTIELSWEEKAYIDYFTALVLTFRNSSGETLCSFACDNYTYDPEDQDYELYYPSVTDIVE